eukprot:Protomagalhaensia_sp_Gyna_25__719@NODE_133_length_4982_cov_70_257738_g105_i0_p2_GENE_NODE_133_length_4982_cov_70_257738_g105_i0NODE_133_length_4982_cov_70_257738_g105_i0_p2_ORF_typecomplete_len343_score49_30LIF_OSM/PF01291_17/5_7e02LIF_OSM/PF01291_17/0_75SNF5/PF04855_12/0_18Opi1/PF08618_10/4_8e03Opi1/PF08618_10/0_24_NODE_133_length_4982_cov_70_257738_g105_i02461274
MKFLAKQPNQEIRSDRTAIGLGVTMALTYSVAHGDGPHLHAKYPGVLDDVIVRVYTQSAPSKAKTTINIQKYVDVRGWVDWLNIRPGLLQQTYEVEGIRPEVHAIMERRNADQPLESPSDKLELQNAAMNARDVLTIVQSLMKPPHTSGVLYPIEVLNMVNIDDLKVISNAEGETAAPSEGSLDLVYNDMGAASLVLNMDLATVQKYLILPGKTASGAKLQASFCCKELDLAEGVDPKSAAKISEEVLKQALHDYKSNKANRRGMATIQPYHEVLSTEEIDSAVEIVKHKLKDQQPPEQPFDQRVNEMRSDVRGLVKNICALVSNAAESAARWLRESSASPN